MPARRVSVCQQSVPGRLAPRRCDSLGLQRPNNLSVPLWPRGPGRPQYDARSVVSGETADLDAPALRPVAGRGQGDYTWGLVAGETTPADIPHPAPVRLEICLLNIGGSPEQEWPVLVVEQEEWETQIWFKTLQSSYPRGRLLGRYGALQRAACLPGADGRRTPSSCSRGRHTAPIAAWDAVLDWPAGYARAMQYNLALELAPQYTVEPSQLVKDTAQESKRALFPINTEIGRLRLNPRRSRVGVRAGV